MAQALPGPLPAVERARLAGRRRRDQWVNLLLLLPGVGFLGLFLVVPLAQVFLRSVGLALIGGMLLFWLIGNATIGTSKAVPLSGQPDLPPSARYPLGTDSAGRQLLPVLIAGVPLTLEVGFLAGGVG